MVAKFGKVGRENWVKDDCVTQCSMCLVEFGLLTRKHHCRACGNIFCSSCSSKEIGYTPGSRKDEQGYAEKKKRVCGKCFQKLSATRSHTAGDAQGTFCARSFFQFTYRCQPKPKDPWDQFDREAAVMIRNRERKRQNPCAPVAAVPATATAASTARPTAAATATTASAPAAPSVTFTGAGAPEAAHAQQARTGMRAETPDRTPWSSEGAGAQPMDAQCGTGRQAHWVFDPRCADEEKAELQALFAYYFEQLQAQKAQEQCSQGPRDTRARTAKRHRRMFDRIPGRNLEHEEHAGRAGASPRDSRAQPGPQAIVEAVVGLGFIDIGWH